MSFLNSVHILGNITRDPDLRFTKENKAVCEMSLAINERYGEKETTLFIDIVSFGKQAEYCGKNLSKGSQILVCGKLACDQWEDKQSGKKMYRTKIIAENIQFLNIKNKTNNNTEKTQYERQRFSPDDFVPRRKQETGDIPF